jgi:hypothetical protein
MTFEIYESPNPHKRHSFPYPFTDIPLQKLKEWFTYSPWSCYRFILEAQ